MVGTFRVHALQAGLQQLDGGAMFGVVPKTLWERKIPADERNRIPLGMRCLLVEHPDALVLIDTGAGNKETDKFYNIYGIENSPVGGVGPTQLESALAEAGFAPADVTMVISSHLHFDHAGGNTRRQDDGSIAVSFPNARYVARAGEWEWAHRANERTSPSYFPHNYDPLREAGVLSQMVMAMRRLGFRETTFSVDLDGLDGVSAPAVVFLKNNQHALTLLRYDQRGGLLWDPGRGRVFMPVGRFERFLAGAHVVSFARDGSPLKLPAASAARGF